MAALKPNEEIMASSFAVASVIGVFSLQAPNLANVRASMPGGAASVNTHKSVKTAVLTSAALVAGMALLAKSPTIYVVGGLTIAVEGWMFYHANATDHHGNVIAPGSAMGGQPSPTLNAGS